MRLTLLATILPALPLPLFGQGIMGLSLIALGESGAAFWKRILLIVLLVIFFTLPDLREAMLGGNLRAEDKLIQEPVDKCSPKHPLVCK